MTNCALLLRPLAGLAMLAALACAACPQDLPPGLKGEPVGQELVVNGLPMTVRQVQGRGVSAELLDQLARDWQQAGHEVKRSRAGHWDVLAARSEQCLATLQLIDRSGVFGYFGVSRPQKTQAWLPRDLGVPLPGGVQLNAAVTGLDGGRRGHTIGFSSARGIDDLDRYFLRQLSGAGWQGVSSHEVRSGAARRARIVSAQKSGAEFSLVLWEDGRTSRALLNLSEPP
ncbi:MAG: hypothetical protein QM788_04125 [Roseateles sp.]|uniref:hypothetical protein n=1 Tax=Roseateles sp. TaxID=1971397 RepID=UPI0039EA2444